MGPTVHFSAPDPGQLIFIIIALVWVFYWKALALWFAARKGEKGWFLAILLINTFSILEIIYVIYHIKESPKHFLKK